MRKCLTLSGLCVLLTLSLARAASPLPAFNNVLQQNDVKVTLLQVAQVTTYTAEGVIHAGGVTKAVPGVYLVFQIEKLGPPAAGGLSLGNTDILIDGKPLTCDESLVAGSVGTTGPCGDAFPDTGAPNPKPAVPAQTKIRTQYLRGLVLTENTIDVRIQIGFGPLQTFLFETVPLTGCGTIHSSRPTVPAATTPLRAVDNERQQEDAKVTLLQIGQVTSFTAEGLRAHDGVVRAVPGAFAVYQIENTSKSDTSTVNDGQVRFLNAAKPIETIGSVEPMQSMATYTWPKELRGTGFATPRPADPSRAEVLTQYHSGMVIDDDIINVQIDVGFGKEMTFKFDNFPVVSGVK